VPAGLKRNVWLRSRIILRKPDLPDAFVLVCPAASSPMRRMPDAIHRKILAHLAPSSAVVTQGSVPQGLEGRLRSRPREDSLAGLCNLVAHARWVISTDTAIVHFADTFDVPCLAFFPTHDPDWRMRDYPHCTPVPLAGVQPAGLEFVRSADDLRAAHRAWFTHGRDLSWLEPLLDAGPRPASDTPRFQPPRPR
jgi:ADP-heptose:LPS heptosyltransferase